MIHITHESAKIRSSVEPPVGRGDEAPRPRLRPRGLIREAVRVAAFPCRHGESLRIVESVQDVVGDETSLAQGAAEVQDPLVAFVAGVVPTGPPALGRVVGVAFADGGALVCVGGVWARFPGDGSIVVGGGDSIDLLGVEDGDELDADESSRVVGGSGVDVQV